MRRSWEGGEEVVDEEVRRRSGGGEEGKLHLVNGVTVTHEAPG